MIPSLIHKYIKTATMYENIMVKIFYCQMVTTATIFSYCKILSILSINFIKTFNLNQNLSMNCKG